jgi:phosphoribosylformylglycinamidine synthase
MKVDARLGALDAVFYPSLQMALKGAKVCAVTDCLNFGNPEKTETMSEFVASVEAITEASKLLQAPVISGNVSFYNETKGVNITSTPATGLIGVRPDVDLIPEDTFQVPEQSVFVLRLKGCEVSLEENAFSGDLNPQAVLAFQNLLLAISQSGLLQSSQMVSLGGLALTLAKMTLSGVGFRSEMDSEAVSWTRDYLYQAVLVTNEPRALELKISEEIENLQGSVDVSLQEIGSTDGEMLRLGGEVQIPLEGLRRGSRDGLKSYFEGV